MARVITDADELEHIGAATESWWWWGASADGSTRLFVELTLRGSRFDHRAGLLRVGHPPVYVEELDGTGRRAGLELKPPELWAGHTCDAPFLQWSVGNEAHGVLLDDPAEVLTRPYGTPTPVTFDVEWYADGTPHEVAGGYEQAGEVDAEIELPGGVLRVQGPGHRVHVWDARLDLTGMLTRVGWLPPTVDGR